MLALAPPAFAQSTQDRIVSELAREGFSEIRISRTLLGRTRIVGVADDKRREIVFNPATGVILRDYRSGEISDDGGGRSSAGNGAAGDDGGGSENSGGSGDNGGSDSNGGSDNGGSDNGGSDNGGGNDNGGGGDRDDDDGDGDDDDGDDAGDD